MEQRDLGKILNGIYKVTWRVIFLYCKLYHFIQGYSFPSTDRATCRWSLATYGTPVTERN